MAFHNYDKKYQMDKKAAEAALQDILAASGQEDAAERSHQAFHKRAADVGYSGLCSRSRRPRWLLQALYCGSNDARTDTAPYRKGSIPKI